MKYNPSCATGGTSIERLTDDACDAAEALRTARGAFAVARPNPRDYADYNGAAREFEDLIQGVDRALDAMMERLEYLSAKRDERRAQRG